MTDPFFDPFLTNLTFTPLYSPTAVTLMVTNAPVEPVKLSARLTGSDFILSWTDDYELETAADLNPPIVWQTATNIVVQGDQRFHTNNVQDSGQAYFRLHKK